MKEQLDKAFLRRKVNAQVGLASIIEWYLEQSETMQMVAVGQMPPEMAEVLGKSHPCPLCGQARPPETGQTSRS